MRAEGMVFAVAFWSFTGTSAASVPRKAPRNNRELGEAFHSLAFPRLALINNGSAPNRYRWMTVKDSFPGPRGFRATGKAFERSKGARGR